MIPFLLIFVGDNVFLPLGASFYFTTAIISTYKSSNLGYLKTFSLLTWFQKLRLEIELEGSSSTLVT